MKINKNFPVGSDTSQWLQLDENQTFLFHIIGTPYNNLLENQGGSPIDMVVTVTGDGETIIRNLPVGTYTITEITDWSWRYTPTLKSQTRTFLMPGNDGGIYTFDFTNTRTNPYWLSGDSTNSNNWGSIPNIPAVIQSLFSFWRREGET